MNWMLKDRSQATNCQALSPVCPDSSPQISRMRGQRPQYRDNIVGQSGPLAHGSANFYFTANSARTVIDLLERLLAV